MSSVTEPTLTCINNIQKDLEKVLRRLRILEEAVGISTSLPNTELVLEGVMAIENLKYSLSRLESDMIAPLSEALGGGQTGML
tara:strand:- start:160 stop:408 length:249 start_codon:yes stop_codon:yes gene_type:complete